MERIIARVEAGPQSTETRFIVTKLGGPSGGTIYQDTYRARGETENHIKAWKTHLTADRTSCGRATANQMRFFLHVGACWLMWSLRSLVPCRSPRRVAQLDTSGPRPIHEADCRTSVQSNPNAQQSPSLSSGSHSGPAPQHPHELSWLD